MTREPGQRQRAVLGERRAARRDRTCRSAASSRTMPIEQADVAGLRDPERLDRRARRLRLVIPEADQQVRADADQLPADEQLQEVRRQHHAHHRKREERLERVVAAERAAPARRSDSRANRPGRAATPASTSSSIDRRLRIGEDADGGERSVPPGSHGHTAPRDGVRARALPASEPPRRGAAARRRWRTTPRDGPSAAAAAAGHDQE